MPKWFEPNDNGDEYVSHYPVKQLDKPDLKFSPEGQGPFVCRTYKDGKLVKEEMREPKI